MTESILGLVINHLSHSDDALRDVALGWLCDGYMDDPDIATSVFQQWQQHTPERAFNRFPQLSFFPVPASLAGQACRLSDQWVQQGQALTSLTTRCAGKLLEQTIRLAPTDLLPHLHPITQIANSHKIFFRIDLERLNQRISLSTFSQDRLFQQLNQAVEDLSHNAEDEQAMGNGLTALEALRRQHPESIDLGKTLSTGCEGSPSQAASFQIALISLVQMAGSDNLLPELSPYLLNSSEKVLGLAVEAIVRIGSGQAAKVLLDQFAQAGPTHRLWIARGLQRMRVANLAPLIRRLRNSVSDTGLYNMLLVAELQQLDPDSGPTVVEAFGEMDAASQAMVDAGMLYTFICAPLQQDLQPTDVELSFRDLLMRIQDKLSRTETGHQQDIRSLRRLQSRQREQIFKKRNK
ncbi:MAG TPA: hypothetical protein DCF63_15920 [Planctomycetaceae bacterium]|nr:hypothetical protein [Planctomycetaceae bacterium]